MTRLAIGVLSAVTLGLGYLVPVLAAVISLAIVYWPLTAILLVIALALSGCGGWALLLAVCLLCIAGVYLFQYIVRPS